MSTPFLHHYALSPFSEKIRLVFGLKDLAWGSVQIPDRLPKPDYLALTGGYRRTPSLQIGADVYCDTALIAEELEQRWPTPTLWPDAAAGLHRIVERWAETALFWPCALYVTGVNAEALPAAFHADRAAMRGRPPPTPASLRAAGERARERIASQLLCVEQLLDGGRDFLLGEAPGLADLAVYHALWFLEQLPRRLLASLAPSAALMRWFARVAALGHGARTELDAAAALAIARDSSPLPAACEGAVPWPYGRRVAVAPAEETSAAVLGELVGWSPTRLVLAREDPRTGRVHVHFPRAGYRVDPA
ncbi:MAG TPA: glutathione S-transferase family protein [Gammaproteobacteria bacterium]|nr:glutathione S-transferase family protein [Gammaproteobacteria bacterium]